MSRKGSSRDGARNSASEKTHPEKQVDIEKQTTLKKLRDFRDPYEQLIRGLKEGDRHETLARFSLDMLRHRCSLDRYLLLGRG